MVVVRARMFAVACMFFFLSSNMLLIDANHTIIGAPVFAASNAANAAAR